ncbi:unnamed protein product [Linum trigynum]
MFIPIDIYSSLKWNSPRACSWLFSKVSGAQPWVPMRGGIPTISLEFPCLDRWSSYSTLPPLRRSLGALFPVQKRRCSALGNTTNDSKDVHPNRYSFPPKRRASEFAPDSLDEFRAPGSQVPVRGDVPHTTLIMFPLRHFFQVARRLLRHLFQVVVL